MDQSKRAVKILVLYYSQTGHTQTMAKMIARGIESHDNTTAIIRTVPPVSAQTEQTQDSIPDEGAPYVTLQDLSECDGLALGSPTRFGNMAAPLKYFIDQTGGIWFSGDMVDKPFVVFTSTSSLHGGQESTLLSMILPCLHHGMVYVGIPYTEPGLNQTKRGGTPYGASHWSEDNQQHGLGQEEKSLCIALGTRLAKISHALHSSLA